jgi:crotonobetainyl-CoA:carnitine CoA-transferase CaiB-like acyl-CoA transferase
MGSVADNPRAARDRPPDAARGVGRDGAPDPGALDGIAGPGGAPDRIPGPAGAPDVAPDPGAADGNPEPTGPLRGLAVCDFSTVLAGPYCTMLLADLGAAVVKVEPPGGDGTRRWGPPYAGAPQPGFAYPPGDPRADPAYPGEATYYLAINRNKRDIRLDVRAPGGAEVLRRLLARSDVFVENYRPGGLARMGFPDAELERLNPRLVHLAISGYGPDGPYRDRPGYDFILQAMAGLMSITGRPDAEGGEPTKVGVAIADLATGMLGAVAILAALAGRERPGSPAFGRGQRIDLSLLEGTVAWLANQASGYLAGGILPGRRGNEHPSITPYETFRTADGTVALAVGSERQWRAFCDVLGRPDLADDERFASNAARVAHRADLLPQLREILATAPTSHWIARLVAAEVPCGPINDLAAVFADPQVLARRMVESAAHPTIGEVRMTGIPYKLSVTPGNVRTAPPLIGQHAAEILGELGFDPGEIERLRRDRVL